MTSLYDQYLLSYTKMDVVLTFRNAPPPDDPPTAQEVAHYEAIVVKACVRNNLPSYVDELLAGFNGIYAENVPDTFLDLANKYIRRWSDISQQEMSTRLVRIAENGSKDLRRLYAFWLERCSGKITNDTRCCVILRVVHELCIQWAEERREHNYNLFWKDPEDRLRYPDYIINQNDLVDQIHIYLFHPDRVRRLTRDYIRQMIEHACEN